MNTSLLSESAFALLTFQVRAAVRDEESEFPTGWHNIYKLDLAVFEKFLQTIASATYPNLPPDAALDRIVVFALFRLCDDLAGQEVDKTYRRRAAASRTSADDEFWGGFMPRKCSRPPLSVLPDSTVFINTHTLARRPKTRRSQLITPFVINLHFPSLLNRDRLFSAIHGRVLPDENLRPHHQE